MRWLLVTVLALAALGCDGDGDTDDGGGTDAGELGDAGADDAGPSACTVADLDAWTSAVSLPANRESVGAVIIDDQIHVFGGWAGAAASDTSWRSPIGADGSLGAVAVGESLPAAVERAAPARVGELVYVMGGDDGVSAALDAVWVGDLGADGSITGWRAATSLPTPRLEHAVISRENDFVVIGGATSLGGGGSTLVTVGTPSGDTIAWTDAEALPVGLTFTRAAVLGAWLFVTGDGAAVYRAPLDTLTGWTEVGPHPGGQAIALSAVGDGLVATGGLVGRDGQAGVRTAIVGADGSLGAWTDRADLPATRFGHRSVASGSHVYLVGGWMSFGAIHDDVLAASPCP